MVVRFAFLLLLAAALPALAETYKWVDEKGRVHYSNAPPPESAKNGQVVEERISVMGMDPAVRASAERRFAEQARAEEADWQRRQLALAAQQAYAPPARSGYTDGYAYGYPYYYGAAYVPAYYRSAVRNRLAYRTAPPRVSHYAGGPRISHHSRGTHASRGSSRR